MSKGSTPRPLSVPQETYAERWEKTFSKGRHTLDVVYGDPEGGRDGSLAFTKVCGHPVVLNPDMPPNCFSFLDIGFAERVRVLQEEMARLGGVADEPVFRGIIGSKRP